MQVGDDKLLRFGSGAPGDISIAFDEDGDNSLEFIRWYEGQHLELTFWADDKDDNADGWKLQFGNNGNYSVQSYSGGSWAAHLTVANNGNCTISGALSKGSGSFKIDHPLPSKKKTHYLVHSFVESPKADLLYRGKVTLVDGRADVNIDTAAGMTEGTFVALCDDVQCFTTNESDWHVIKGSVTGNILTILSEDAACTSEISWLVLADRKDEHMLDSETDWTDDNGKPIVEPVKADDKYWQEYGKKQKVIKSTEPKSKTRTKVVFEDGKYVQKQYTDTWENKVETPQFTEHDLYNEAGEIIGTHKEPIYE